MVSREALDEFKNIWLAEYGEKITDEEAMPKAIALLALFDVVYRPIPKSWMDNYDHEPDATNLRK
jgi:hypothetical protein